MQKNVFVGNLAKAVVVSGNGDRAVALGKTAVSCTRTKARK